MIDLRKIVNIRCHNANAMKRNPRDHKFKEKPTAVDEVQSLHVQSVIHGASHAIPSFKGIANPIVGWREWVSLPSLGIEHLEAKIDTGARSSSLDAHHIESFKRDRAEWLRFQLYTDADLSQNGASVEAPLVGYRDVRSSSGHVTHRPVIQATIQVGAYVWPIELTLCNRHSMGYRILLGRSAIDGRFLVDSSKSYIYRR